MENSLIQDIIRALSNYNALLLIIENNDGFLFRTDVIKEFNRNNIIVSIGNNIFQRVSIELRDKTQSLFLINKEKREYKEDIENISIEIEFFLSQFLSEYHIPTVIDLPLSTLDKLYNKHQLFKLSNIETKKEIDLVISDYKTTESNFDIEDYTKNINKNLERENIDWQELSLIVGKALSKTIERNQHIELFDSMKIVNEKFQEFIQKNYAHIKNSNFIKRPQIVSKILDYIDFNFKKESVALIVIDGFSYWQYCHIAHMLPGIKKETNTFSWIPSITQLSRQAIFRGSSPLESYKQNPSNESKLWKEYWKKKQYNEFEIDYQHDSINLTNIDVIKRLGIVYKDLDDYMHSSKDYKDLIKLTENWFERSNINNTIEELLFHGFRVIITSDHGNIQAKGWRGLSGKEKLGTNNSGSRSERHLEYSEKWLKDEFLNNNSDLIKSIVQEENSIYFKDDLSFSRREYLVTHGGAHFLEVVIPFIEITNE